MGEIIKYTGSERKRSECLEDEVIKELLDKVDFDRLHEILTELLKKSLVPPPYNLLTKGDIYSESFLFLGLGGSPAVYDSENNSIKVFAPLFYENDFSPNKDTILEVFIGVLVHEMVHAASPNKNHTVRNGEDNVRVSESGVAWRMWSDEGLLTSHELINEGITEYITSVVLAEYFGDEKLMTEKVEIDFDLTTTNPETQGIIEANDNLDFFEALTESIAKHNTLDAQDLRDRFVRIYFHPAGNLDNPELKEELERLITPEVKEDIKDKAQEVRAHLGEGYTDHTILVRSRWAKLISMINAKIVHDDQWD